jgi:tetratricopeptide (TPR) repeat protein
VDAGFELLRVLLPNRVRTRATVRWCKPLGSSLQDKVGKSMEILNALSQYANLINLALLITIIGWLFSLTQIYKENITEKFDAKLAAKDVEVKSLTERLTLANEQLEFQKTNSSQQIESTKNDLQRTEKWYEREISALREKLSGTLSNEGITTESLVMNLDTSILKSEFKTIIVDVLKEITEIETKIKYDDEKIQRPEFFLDLAKGYYLSKQWLEAAKNCDKYVEYFPTDWEAHILRGVSYMNSRNGNSTDLAALHAYHEAIVFMPDNVESELRARLFTYRGAAAKRLNRLDEAESDLLLAQKFASTEYRICDIKYNLAAVYALRGDRLKMLEMVSALKEHPEFLMSVQAHLNDYFSKYVSDMEFIKMIQ